MADQLLTLEVFGYRVHRTPHDIHEYQTVRRSVSEKGIVEPLTLTTDGRHVFLEDGHKRVEAAVELGIKSLPVQINKRPFSKFRRYKFPMGEGLIRLLRAEQEPPAPAPAKKAPAKPRKKSPAKATAK